ncbi:hypothetical protein BH10ACI2_BH10ACI2_18100 [soil metagenome]
MPTTIRQKLTNAQIAIITAISFVIYFLSNPTTSPYDYTTRVAGNFLNGYIGFAQSPPGWLNEFVPFEGSYYSVFPLGSVLTMVPFAVLKSIANLADTPTKLIGACCGAATCVFLLMIARCYGYARFRTILLSLAIIFGTWMWTNVTMGGAWQSALGFAVVGQLGAIYFTVFNRHPFIAGLFFAMGFGNRTEVLLTAPIFFFLLTRPEKKAGRTVELSEELTDKTRTINSPENTAETRVPFPNELTYDAPVESRSIDTIRNHFRNMLIRIVWFSSIPFLLGVLTLIYNYIRFHSFTDFGYARIPGVLEEPWYNHGIFSMYYIPQQAWQMLFKLWEFRSHFPLPIPNGFSSSILIGSPFLVLLSRWGAKDRALKYLSWAAILVICTLLWMHGNSGGWQFGYRYAMVLLPWMFVILLENSRNKVSTLETVLYLLSFIANAYATWLFNWTQNIKV